MTVTLLRLISHLPYSVLHGLARLLGWFASSILKYRQQVIRGNLKRSFPEASVHWLKQTERSFYNHFADKLMLLREVLDVYNNKNRVENEEIIAEADNVLEAMGHLHQKIVRRSHQVNPNFFSDIINLAITFDIITGVPGLSISILIE